MEWWQQLGNMMLMMPDSPALAFDMTVNGAADEAFGYSLAYNMQNSPTKLEIYPPEGMTFPEGE